MNVFDSMEVLSSGMHAEQMRLDVTNSNMVNAKTTRTPDGGPYRRKDPVFVSVASESDPFGAQLSGALNAVQVEQIVDDTRDPRKVYDPSHPDAGGDGYVSMPNVSVVEEMVNMLSATRAYEAQLTAMHGVVQMAEKAMTLGQ